jgi:hypothetical protein
MKPKWESAPDEAIFLGKDGDGKYWWYFVEPDLYAKRLQFECSGNDCMPCVERGPNDGIMTLEARP